jgi:hypothetical protein
MDLELFVRLVVLIGLLSKGKISQKDFFSDFQSNRPQGKSAPSQNGLKMKVKSAPSQNGLKMKVKSTPSQNGLKMNVKSTPSQNGLKMKVKSATYFKLNKKNVFILIRHILLSINTPGIRAHETVAGTKNAGAEKRKSKNKVGICKRSFLRHSKFLQ